MEKQLKEQSFLHDSEQEDVYRYGNCDPRVSAHEYEVMVKKSLRQTPGTKSF